MSYINFSYTLWRDFFPRGNWKYINLPLCTIIEVNASQSFGGPNCCPNQDLGVLPRISSIQGGGPGPSYCHGFVLALESHQEMNQPCGMNKPFLDVGRVLG